MLKGIFVYSKNEAKWLEKLNGQPRLSQEFEAHFHCLPLNEARLDGGRLVKYTQCMTEPYIKSVLEFVRDHKKQWKDTEVLGTGEVHSILGIAQI